MSWQEEAQRIYQQRLAEQERAKQQASELQRALLKAQFAEQQRLKAVEQQQREIEQTARELQAKQQHSETVQRLTNDLKRSNQERRARLQDAQIRAKQRKLHETKIWISLDGREFRSPREQEFWDAWQEKQEILPLVPQHPIGRFRVDFAHLPSMTVIELDGRLYHTNRYAFTNDRVRQRILEKQGWSFIRFSGDEVSGNIEGCVTEVYELIKTKQSR